MKISNIIQKLNEILAYLDDLQLNDRLPYDDYSTLYDMITEPLQQLEAYKEEEK